MTDNNKRQQNTEKIANKSYEPSDYQSNDETAQGLAITHEQVSDAYMEGTIDAKIDQVDVNSKINGGEGEAIPRKGFDE